MKESQKIMMKHSEVKIRLLKLYLERYLNILSRSPHFKNVYVFDLFCGEGIYDENDKGSPVVILETIKKTFYANKSNGLSNDKFFCLFNDIDKKKIEKLKHEISCRKLHYAETGGLSFSNEDYRDLLPKVCCKIKTLSKEKAFVFLDPYGYKHIRISDIISLLQNKKSEVLLFLPTQFMFRFNEKAAPDCLIEFIDELMPVEKWPVSQTGIDFIENLKEAFRSTLGQDFFVDSFIITRDINQYFCLFFFTSHIYGFDRMLDAKWKIDEEEGRGWDNNTDHSLFSQINKRANTLKFEKKLVEFIKSERTNSQVYQFTLYNGHLPSHTTEIFIKLQNQGKLSVTMPDGLAARKSSFYLSYKEHKRNPNRVLIKLK